MESLFSLRYQWILFIFVFLSAFAQAEEKLFIPFDDRAWKIGFEAQTQDEKLKELVLQNEEIEDWSELFTVQIFNGLPASTSEFVTALEKTFKKNLSPQESLQFKIMEKDPFNIFENSFISNTTTNNEYNIGRVIKGRNDLYYLQYSTKDERLFKQNQEAWIQRLKSAYLASVPHENQQGRWLSFTSKSVHDQGKLLNYPTGSRIVNKKKLHYGLSTPKD